MPTVKFFGNLRKYVDISQLQFPSGSIRAVVEALCEGNPPLCEALLEYGHIRPHFIITLNGRHIQLAEGLDTPVIENDQIAIFPPIAGG